MALQFHPEYANLLAVGCYDGSVAVYDVRQKINKPLYSMSAKAKKHSDTVWQVCWQVSNRGQVGRWWWGTGWTCLCGFAMS